MLSSLTGLWWQPASKGCQLTTNSGALKVGFADEKGDPFATPPRRDALQAAVEAADRYSNVKRHAFESAAFGLGPDDRDDTLRAGRAAYVFLARALRRASLDNDAKMIRNGRRRRPAGKSRSRPRTT